MTLAPRACTASIRHERTGSPSSEHGARAAHAVLAAEVRARELEVLAEEVGEGLARPRPRRRRRSPFTSNEIGRVSVMRRPSLVRRLRSVLAGPAPARPSGDTRRSRAGRRSVRGRATASAATSSIGAPCLIAASASTALTGRSETLMSAMRTSPPGATDADGGDHREVAVATRHLLHRDPGAGSGVRERDPREDLVGLEGGREVARRRSRPR